MTATSQPQPDQNLALESAPASAALPPSRLRSPLACIFFTIFLDVLGLGIIIPIAPELVKQFDGGNEALAATHVGLLAAIYALMQFFFAPILGSLSDNFGRRPVILFSLLGSGIDYIAMALAPSLGFLYITRVINGITGASVTAATAYIADISPPEKRAGNFGVIGAAFGLGFTFGPLLGGWLGEMDSSLRLPFYVAAGLCLLNALYGYFVLPESLKPAHRRPFTWQSTNPLSAFTLLAKHKVVLGLTLSLFLLFTAEYSLRNTWVLYTSHRYKWTPIDVGFSLFVVGISAAIVQGLLARKIIPKLGERKSMLFGFALVIVGYVCYGLVPDNQGWLIYVIIAFASLGGIGGPAVQGLISRSVGASEQGAIQGAITSLQSLAGIFGPLMGTNLFGYFISDQAPVRIPGIAFFVGAMLASIALANALVVLIQARRLQRLAVA